MKLRLLAIALLVLTCSAFADQLTLTNGDRLTGAVIKFDDQKLSFKPDYADTITIPWSLVSKITADKPLHIERSDKTALTAPAVEASGDQVTVESVPPVTVPAKEIKTIRSDAQELAYEQSLHPNWRQAWHGGGNFGLALARGNSDTTNISIGFTAERKGLRDKTSLYMNTVYSTDGILNVTTANDIRGGVRYDHDFDTRLFGFVSGDFEHDAIQNLTLRSIFGAGVGLHAINTKTTSLDLLAGGAYTRENYGNPANNNNFVSIELGETFSKTLNSTTTFTEKAFIYPYLNSIGDYRATFDAGVATKLSRLLTWQVNLSERYVTNPPAATKKNDLLLTTGLGVTFGKKE
jgi:putative salt-induced outer membrane protein